MTVVPMLRSSIAPLVAASVLLVAGCSGDNPAGNPGNTAHTVPKPGSSYTFKSYPVDSNGTKIQGPDQTVIWTVTDNDLSYNGKTGVVKIVAGNKVGYLSHAANGDLIGTSSDASASGIGNVWVTYPFGSKGTFTYPVIDSVVVQQGETARIRFSGTAVYIGEEDVVVKGETFRAQKVLDKYSHVTEKDDLPTVTMEVENTLWYAPKLGYFVKQKTTSAMIVGTSGFRSRIVGEMTDYSLK